MRMKNRFLTKFMTLLSISFFVSIDGPALAQGNKTMQALQAVVMLTVGNEIGSGIILGEDGAFLYLATAHHVVSAATAGDKTIEAEFHKNKKSDNVTIIPLEKAAALDIAFLKVAKKGLPFEVGMPVIHRIGENETSNSYQLVGRKAKNRKWRRTPLLKVVDRDKLPYLDASETVLEFSVPADFQGYSGGGAFDEDWQLGGITKGSLPSSDSFDSEEYTVIIKLASILDLAKEFSIPLAPFLRLNEDRPLPVRFFQSIPAMGTSIRRQAPKRSKKYDKSDRSLLGWQVQITPYWKLNDYLPDVNIHIYVRITDNWRLWDQKIENAAGLGTSYQYRIPVIADALAVCTSNRLQTGGYAYNVVISILEEIYVTDNGQPTFSTESNPCLRYFSRLPQKL